MLTDSNTNELESHGFVKYRIRTKNDLEIGDEIFNTAYIYFDFNEPVATNTVLNSVVVFPGINENSTEIPLYIYPNPNNGIITIESNLDNYGNTKSFYQLTDITGKTLLQGTATTSKFNLDISALSSGVYFISITDGEKQVYGKVVKE